MIHSARYTRLGWEGGGWTTTLAGTLAHRPPRGGLGFKILLVKSEQLKR